MLKFPFGFPISMPSKQVLELQLFVAHPIALLNKLYSSDIKYYATPRRILPFHLDVFCIIRVAHAFSSFQYSFSSICMVKACRLCCLRSRLIIVMNLCNSVLRTQPPAYLKQMWLLSLQFHKSKVVFYMSSFPIQKGFSQRNLGS